MINIQSITYTNEAGESITVNFEETELSYRADRITDLVREMLAGGRDMGPPPKPPSEPDMAWMGGGGY